MLRSTNINVKQNVFECKMGSLLTVTLRAVYLLVSLHYSTAQDCLHEYIQQPPTTLRCNPFGSNLQLLCVTNGPLDPQFQLTWYSSPANNTENIVELSSQPGYSIQTVVLNNSGQGLRTVSSMLVTNQIGDNNTQTCLWCRIEINGDPLPVQSSTLCILEEMNYSGLPNCSVSPPSGNFTRVCANPAGGPELTTSTSLASSIIIQASTVQPQVTPLFLLPTSSQPHTVNSSTIYSTAITNTPLIKASDANTPTYSQDYLPTESSISQVIETTTQASFPLSMTVTPSNVPVDSRLDALYATITVCIMFVIVIMVLAGIIIFQSRRKLEGMLHSSKNGNHGSYPVLSNAFADPHSPEVASVSESRAHPPLETANGNITRSNQNSDAVASSYQPKRVSSPDHDYSDIEDVSPTSAYSKPIQNSHVVICADGADETDQPKGLDSDYDHLKPTAISDHPDENNGDCNTEKKHFYYMLEDSTEKEHSGKSSRIMLNESNEEKETISLKSPIDNVKAYRQGMYTLSLEELFDDPKYAMLFVTTKAVNQTAHKTQMQSRRDFCYSTQSLGSAASLSQHGSLANERKRFSQSTDGLHQNRKTYTVAVEIHDHM